jgi:hypothetical protein
MAQPSVAAKVHKALYIAQHLTAKIALNLVAIRDDRTNLLQIIFGDFIGLAVEINSCVCEYLLRTCASDTIDISKSDFHALIAR